MPKRPREHQLEDLSLNAFNDVIPNNWLFRPKPKDYGIDGEVEIFDNEDNATGLVFLVQLKAKESLDDKEPTYDLEIDKIKYYQSLDLPVLIVRYYHKEGKIFFKWSHEIDLYYAKDGAKTMRVKFSHESLWSNTTHELIESKLVKIRTVKDRQFKFPIPCRIEVQDKIIKNLRSSILRLKLKDEINQNNRWIKVNDNATDLELTITISSQDLTVSLEGFYGCTSHSIHKFNEDEFIEKCGQYVLLNFALIMINIGHAEVGANILMDDYVLDTYLQQGDRVVATFSKVIKSSKGSYFIKKLMDSEIVKQDSDFRALINALMLSESEISNEEKEMFLIRELDKAISDEDQVLIGLSYYNLGSYYSSINLTRKASFCLLKARKFEKSYLTREYYYLDLGGALFRSGKYLPASNMYRKALKIKEEPQTGLLLADALLHSGLFKESLFLFNKYLLLQENPDPEWLLKSICLKQLEKRNIHSKIRRVNQAKGFFNALKPEQFGDIDNISKLIELDFLQGNAWFNYGRYHAKKGLHKDAFIGFLLCSLIHQRDTESWVNTIISFINSNIDIEFLPLIIVTAYRFSRDEFLASLFVAIYKNISDEDVAEELISEIEDILKDEQSENKGHTIRFYEDNGQLINTFVL